MRDNIVTKIFSVVLYAVCPKEWHEGITKRINMIREAMTSNVELKVFWHVLFLPIVLPISLAVALLKSIMVFISPFRYTNYRYILNQLYRDVVHDKRDLKIALKRARLTNDLFVKGAEKKITCGEENPDIIFYVIRPYYYLQPNELIFRNIANLLTQYYYALQKLSYAVNKGYIPIVDWQNYGMLPHAEEYPVNGTTNSWEYYWKQPSGYTLEEVYSSKNVILSTQNIGQFGYIPSCAMNPPFYKYAKMIEEKCPRYSAFFEFNDITQQYIERWYEKLFPKDKTVLGVVVRGASYGRFSTPMHSHPRQIEIEELVKTVKKYKDEWGYEYVFFVNEMEELVDKMRESFENKLIVLPRLRDHIDRPADGIVKNPMYAPGQKYQTNLDYVTEIALLSRCDALIGCMSSGMRTAIMWNNGEYKHFYVFENGLW